MKQRQFPIKAKKKKKKTCDLSKSNKMAMWF